MKKAPPSEKNHVIPRVNVLGVGVCAINMEMALEEIGRWISREERHYICVTGVHGIMESHRNPTLRQIHNNAGLVTPDGMPLVWISRLSGFRHVTRVYGPDLVLALCNHAQAKGYRFFLYGGDPGVPDVLEEKLQERFPNLRFVGAFSPPFRALTHEEDASVVERINRANPDIVLVGLSTPKQEQWMAEHVGKLNAAALIGVGAAFDFLSGRKKQAPRWMQSHGLEWFYRLLQEPHRLWRRYCINNPLFLLLLLLQATGLKHNTKGSRLP